MKIVDRDLRDFGYHSRYPVRTVGPVQPKPYILVSGSRNGGEKIDINILKQFLDYTLLCGGALGIDTRAIEFFLSNGRPVVVMIPTPFSRLYPKSNKPLFRNVCKNGGTIISINTKSHQKFLQRNKFMVHMADVVLIMHAFKKSGSSQTGRIAASSKATLYCVPGSPFCDDFIKLGYANDPTIGGSNES